METAGQTTFLVVGIVFMTATATMIICGLLFDFLLDRRHRARTGRPLMEPVPMPLLMGFYCGMRLIAPRWGISRGHESSIHLASKPVQWASRINAVAVLMTLVAGIAMYLTAPG